MRFYVSAIQHNKEKNAENRVAPTAYDDEFVAETAFFDKLATDRKDTTLDWGVAVFFSTEGVLNFKFWQRPVQNAQTPAQSQQTPTQGE